MFSSIFLKYFSPNLEKIFLERHTLITKSNLNLNLLPNNYLPVKIGDIDLQPCGGTHLKNTIEIGKVNILKIENKGKRNRRIIISLD